MHSRLLPALLLLCSASIGSAQVQPAGWSGPESLRHTEAWTRQQPAFELTHPGTGEPVWQDNINGRHCQWEDLIAAAGGSMPPNIAQTVGDCSSRGPQHGLERTLARQLTRGAGGKWQRVDSQFLYGAARVWIAGGRFGPGDGCNVASVARAAKEIGIVWQSTPGVPAYNGNTAREWGRRGPPESLRAIAGEHRVKTVALLRSVAEVRDAVFNGYGVATGGSWGTADNRSGFAQVDGRWVARRNSRWAHVVCIDGYDGSAPSGRRYFHITNSWGENFHPAPIDNSPRGGFWVEEADIAYMVAEGDTWAFSNVDGFPAGLDLSRLRPKPRLSWKEPHRVSDPAVRRRPGHRPVSALPVHLLHQRSGAALDFDCLQPGGDWSGAGQLRGPGTPTTGLSVGSGQLSGSGQTAARQTCPQPTGRGGHEPGSQGLRFVGMAAILPRRTLRLDSRLRALIAV